MSDRLNGKEVGKFKILGYANGVPPSYHLSCRATFQTWLTEEDLHDLKYIVERVLEDARQDREEEERRSR